MASFVSQSGRVFEEENHSHFITSFQYKFRNQNNRSFESISRHSQGPVRDATPSRNPFYLFNSQRVVNFSPVFVDFSWQEEFQAATNLVSKLLLKGESNRKGDFAEGKSNSVLQDLNQASNCP